jgi:hypothetical protein
MSNAGLWFALLGNRLLVETGAEKLMQLTKK